MLIFVPFALLWTMCSTAKVYNDYYYSPYNSSRTTPVGIAAYRSALTLDWMSAEDSRQRELVSAFEHDPQFPSPITRSDCISYNRPTAGSVARLMLEVMKNLEGDDGFLVAHLVQALVRAKLLMLETTMFENEPDFEALVKTPAAMIGEPHTTFPRIVEVLWMAVTDPSTVKKHGWCIVNKMTSFILASRPIDIAKHMRATEQIVSRARFIMEEFIQHVTPLNMDKPTRPTTIKSSLLPTPTVTPRIDLLNKRPVRRHPDIQASYRAPMLLPKSLPSSSTEELDSLIESITEESKQYEDSEVPEDPNVLKRLERIQTELSSSSALHEMSKYLSVSLLFVVEIVYFFLFAIY